MSTDLFNISWFIIFILVIFIAFIANMIIILAILRDKSMHTSTYFYIINVNISDIILVLSCLPERITAVFYSSEGFHLGMYTCKFERTVFHDLFKRESMRKSTKLYRDLHTKKF
jgi:hypothetical protein